MSPELSESHKATEEQVANGTDSKGVAESNDAARSNNSSLNEKNQNNSDETSIPGSTVDLTESVARLAQIPPDTPDQLTPRSDNQSNAAPSTVARQRLANLMSRRPSRLELQLRNIIRINSNECLADNSGQLKFSVPSKSINERSQILKSCLKRRASRKELIDRNIIKGCETAEVVLNNRRLSVSPVAPSLIDVCERLKKQQISDTLNDHLINRPSPAEIPKRILTFDDQVAVSETFKKTAYNRKPDQQATYRRLTPRLKQEIRAELNEFKRNEMTVHEESLSNTTFH